MKRHLILCDCGKLQGSVDLPCNYSHIVCYCSDCQAYARFLSAKNNILDEKGGTQIVQVPPSKVKITQGYEYLTAVKLTEKGMLRWYSKCCDTPIGNTKSNYKLSFVGLLHCCLDNKSLEEDFEKPHSLLNTKSAYFDYRIRDKGVIQAIIRFFIITLSTRFNGQYKKTPFFSCEGKPVVEAKILKLSEYLKLKRLG